MLCVGRLAHRDCVVVLQDLFVHFPHELCSSKWDQTDSIRGENTIYLMDPGTVAEEHVSRLIGRVGVGDGRIRQSGPLRIAWIFNIGLGHFIDDVHT